MDFVERGKERGEDKGWRKGKARKKRGIRTKGRRKFNKKKISWLSLLRDTRDT
jgi:hypothetical protein